ncbi:unnamed protein product [Zymoseptoria tritici ST99CH_1E4]|uniref:Uncharacterized protein n=2 Tax=Zymoseptoria tritici TaxID=1047171 RepID=A0A2H1FL66_ZYMTR|nr:unnamed protein product [Zymoseptoria tritici ST99CH_1E4]
MSSNGPSSSSLALPSGSRPSTAAADVSFTPRNPQPVESRIPRWRRSRSSKSPSDSDNTSVASRSSYNGKRAGSSELPLPASEGRNGTVKSTPKRLMKSGGFLLDSAFANGHFHKKELNDSAVRRNVPQVQVEKAKTAADRVSGDSSRRGSPLSRQVSNDDSTGYSGRSYASPSPSMDPAQLVQMALSLSESRKRHVSSTLPVPISPAGTRRVVSDRPFNKRSSLLSDGVAHISPESPRSSGQYGSEIVNDGAELVSFNFSPATLSRADKARRYFELASEHRRLLEHLPPLKSDRHAHGNYTLQANSSPGSAHYDLTRVPSHINAQRGLGRSYNPLQSLRNRRLRNRERRSLPAPPDTWQQTDRIKAWINNVETASKDPAFRPGGDHVRLPSFPGELRGQDQVQANPSARHRRTDTVTSVITRPENGWTIEPAELLADTYWLEKRGNKACIEDRHGNKLFPNLARASVDLPRRSKEYHGKDTDPEHDATSDKYSLKDETEDENRTKLRRRDLLPIPGLRRKNHASRSASVESGSSDEGRGPAHRYGDARSGGENTGPLERHMRDMMVKEANGELSSPETHVSDHWDTQRKQIPGGSGSIGRAQRESVSSMGGRLSTDFTAYRRVRSADGRAGSVGHRNESEEKVFGGPLPAKASGSAQPATLQHAPSTSRRTEDTDQELRSKDQNHVERHDFAETFDTPLYPVVSGEPASIKARASLEIPRAPRITRHKTSDSFGSGLRRSDTSGTIGDKSTKDGKRRFFKAGRIGEIVRTEGSRIGDRLRSGRDRSGEVAADSSKAHSDSDAEEDRQDNYDSEVSPRASLDQSRPKAKYHTSGLPSFKSPSARGREHNMAESTASDDSDTVNRQRTRKRADRSASPTLPTINLPNDNTTANMETPAERMNYSMKSASQQHLSFGALPAIRAGDRRGALVTAHGGRRHWSISDPTHQQKPRVLEKVTARDIARIRALLLATGIKAHEIHQQADDVNDKRSGLILKVSELTGDKMTNVTRKEECLVAGRLLSDDISTTLGNFEKTVQHFQSTTAKDLSAQLDELSHRVSDQLTKLVHETSDEADAFNVELTTKQPQEVKRVDEAVDEMLRQRRRQFRLLRRTGFKLLEWLVLGIMWWLWFLVVLFNMVKKVVMGGVRAVRWLVWF